MLTLPIYDLPTRSASGFLIRYVVPRSMPPQLIGPLARRSLFFALGIGDTIIGVGHGSPSQFNGHKGQVILDIHSLPDVKDKVVILISCETAQILGPEIIRAGASSFIGFKEDFVWVTDADLASTPWSDPLAATALIPVTNCVNIVLNGKPTGEAFSVLIEGLSQNAAAEEDDLVKSCLEFNHDNAVLLGDASARVRSRPNIRFPVPPPPIILPA